MHQRENKGLSLVFGWSTLSETFLHFHCINSIYLNFRILWMVPIYALNAVSISFFSNKQKTNITSIAVVDRPDLPQRLHLRGQRQGMLRSLRHLQFYEIPPQLFKHGNGFGGEFRVQTAS